MALRRDSGLSAGAVEGVGLFGSDEGATQLCDNQGLRNFGDGTGCGWPQVMARPVWCAEPREAG